MFSLWETAVGEQNAAENPPLFKTKACAHTHTHKPVPFKSDGPSLFVREGSRSFLTLLASQQGCPSWALHLWTLSESPSFDVFQCNYNSTRSVQGFWNLLRRDKRRVADPLDPCVKNLLVNERFYFYLLCVTWVQKPGAGGRRFSGGTYEYGKTCGMYILHISALLVGGKRRNLKGTVI